MATRIATSSVLAAAFLLPLATSAQDLQAKRIAFIKKGIAAGVFYKLERPASLCHLWVGPQFAGLPFDAKESAVNIVYAYCVTERPAEKIVVLKHFATGKQIGAYADGLGLRLD
jgi:hypothetical protein